MKKPRTKNVVSWVLSLVMIAAGAALIASFFLAGSFNSTATNSSDPGGFNVPRLDTENNNAAASGPKDKTLKLTVPKMAQIKDDTVPTAPGTNMQVLGDHAAIHLAGTGFPWDDEANVFKEFTVGPTDLSVTNPVPDKNVLTLQTCTLPDYSQRLIVQAELTNTAQNAA
jgi:sortase A